VSRGEERGRQGRGESCRAGGGREKKWTKENGGKRKKKEGGAGQLGATRHPPIPNVLCMDTSPFGDVWHCATLANADVAFCHVTKW
jgi:hypothetical protein